MTMPGMTGDLVLLGKEQWELQGLAVLLWKYLRTNDLTAPMIPSSRSR